MALVKTARRTFAITPLRGPHNKRPSDRMRDYQRLVCESLKQHPTLSKLAPRVMVSSDPGITGYVIPTTFRATITLKGYHPIDFVEYERVLSLSPATTARQFVSALSRAMAHGLVRREGERFVPIG